MTPGKKEWYQQEQEGTRKGNGVNIIIIYCVCIYNCQSKNKKHGDGTWKTTPQVDFLTSQWHVWRCTHQNIHSLGHTYTNTYTVIHICSQSHTHTHSCTDIDKHTPTYTVMHIYLQTPAQLRTCTISLMQTFTNTHPHTHIIHKHTLTHAQLPINTHIWWRKVIG